MYRVGITEPAHLSTGEQEGLRQGTARNRGERAAPGAPRKSSRHLGWPQAQARNREETGVGSGWQWQAAQPSGWDQALQTTSITPQLWAWLDRAHTQDTQREACGIWGGSLSLPQPGKGGGLWQCSQQKLLPS